MALLTQNELRVFFTTGNVVHDEQDADDALASYRGAVVQLLSAIDDNDASRVAFWAKAVSMNNRVMDDISGQLAPRD